MLSSKKLESRVDFKYCDLTKINVKDKSKFNNLLYSYVFKKV